MTTVSFYSVTVSADAPSTLCRLVRQFDARGDASRAFAACGRCDEFSDVENPHAGALTSEFTGPSVARSGAADSEVAPQLSALVACCRFPELPLAVSGCLVPATTFVHVPVIGCLMLVLSERRARSVLHAGLKPNVESGDLIATTECFDVTPAIVSVKSAGVRVAGVRVVKIQRTQNRRAPDMNAANRTPKLLDRVRHDVTTFARNITVTERRARTSIGFRYIVLS
jgi:hypothetical protein